MTIDPNAWFPVVRPAAARRIRRAGSPRALGAAALTALLLAAPAMLQAQQSLSDLSLEELMRLDTGQVVGAAERPQAATEAPASVSFVTAEEIEKYGYRSLAEILRAVRGFYISDDRNFSWLGARGFGKPGDYNNRILLLVNGHRVNDNVFGQAEIGAELGLDPAVFERVEIIRGPASSLYGDSAFFAVVNIITKSGSALDGVSATGEAGSLGTHLMRGSFGRRLDNGPQLALAGTYQGSAGVDRLFFPEFDSASTNGGIAQGLDGEQASQFYGQAETKHVSVTAAYGRRRRDVPTASFGTLFNAQDPREQTIDRHAFVDLAYTHPVAAGRVNVRTSLDRFTYDGTYPMPVDGALLVGMNNVIGTRWTVDGRVTHPLPGRQLLIVGGEFVDNISQSQWAVFDSPATALFAMPRSSLQQALFAQDEITLARWLRITSGVRYDRYEQFQQVTPRGALIVSPSPSQSFKYLYGRAFRAPNMYELNEFYFGDGVRQLRPESVDTHEIVWERYVHDWLRTSASTYWYSADRLITLAPDETTFLGATFMNAGAVHARGLELEAQMRLARGVQGTMSYTEQRASDVATGADLVNSPRRTAAVRLSVPGPLRRSTASVEWRVLGSRTTLAGQTLRPAPVADLTLVAPLGRAWALTSTVRNLFDLAYADPASSEHRQDVIPQNGRTVRIGLRWTIR